MTDENVIETFDLCTNGFCLDDKCPFCIDEDICSRPLLYKAVLDLIKRQKAEIAYWMDEAVNAKKEAVKGFAERLKGKKTSICAGHGMSTDVVYIGHIDAIAKEMMGEEK